MIWRRAKIVRIVDADTLILKKKHKFRKVRLVGVDALETHDNDRSGLQLEFIKNNINRDFTLEKLIEMANEAKRYVAAQVLGKEIEYRNYGIDKYGRDLVYIRYVNYSLVRRGFAFTFMGKKLHHLIRVSLLSAQDDAKKYKDGIWNG